MVILLPINWVAATSGAVAVPTNSSVPDMLMSLAWAVVVAAARLTVWPVEMFTVSPGDGTVFKFHVVGSPQGPDATLVKLRPMFETSEMLSIETGGVLPPEASFCQVKIRRNVVPARLDGRKT
jgi:hypothetical protein